MTTSTMLNALAEALQKAGTYYQGNVEPPACICGQTVRESGVQQHRP